jgi:hypothetical protein
VSDDVLGRLRHKYLSRTPLAVDAAEEIERLRRQLTTLSAAARNLGHHGVVVTNCEMCAALAALREH